MSNKLYPSQAFRSTDPAPTKASSTSPVSPLPSTSSVPPRTEHSSPSTSSIQPVAETTSTFQVPPELPLISPFSPEPSTSNLTYYPCLSQSASAYFTDTSTIPSSISTSQVTQESPFSNTININSQQLKALQEHTFFIYDETTKSDLLMYFNRLANPQTQTFADARDQQTFQKFQDVTRSLMQVFETPARKETPVKVTLTTDDFFKMPSFKGKGKYRNPKTTPTLPNLISGEEFRTAFSRKIQEKDEEEKMKLVKRMEKEENKKKKDEENESNKLVRERKKVERQQKNDQSKKAKGQKRKVIRLSKESDIEEELFNRMESEINAADIAIDLNNKELCPGCGKKEGDLL
ncbi:swi5-dependent recombination DNA repair protein 1 [Biomphalaria glabrata]|nr:swi5-dependent recombination DNA repair protein 1 [Biomphalaria glabrata]